MSSAQPAVSTTGRPPITYTLRLSNTEYGVLAAGTLTTLVPVFAAYVLLSRRMENDRMNITELDGSWTLRAVAGPVPETVAGRDVSATVPGCVHTDLIAAGLLDDPYLHLNEEKQHWVGRSTWRYSRSFQVADMAAGTHELVFEGLDTVAEISVNGHHVGRTANMHREYRFDVTEVVRPGDNLVEVTFSPVREYAEAVRAEVGDRPNVYPEPFQYVRKMAANFGWDWGPNLVTAGIWKAAHVASWSGARIATVRPHVRLDGADGRVDVDVEIARDSGDTGYVIEVAVAGVEQRVTVGDSALIQLKVPDVHVWHPRGHGEQPLYRLDVRLADQQGHALDSWTRRVGFRAAELVTEPDEGGTSFVLRVNSEPLFIRGVNWIPDDCFVSGLTGEHYRRRVQQAIDANVNLIRVWGGGIYEKDELYEVCDELGVLVWQDFLFACAAYPEQEPLRSEVEAEARDNVTRLMSHPSLVLWNGNNENIWGFHDWGWQEPLAGRDWGLGYYTELLPRIVGELDPSRTYWPGSPYSGTPDIHPNHPSHGNTHLWKVWNERDYTSYADERPRFVSEFGFQGPANRSTIDRSIDDHPLTPTSPGFLNHQKAGDGPAKLDRGMRPHLPEPASFEEWHFTTQLNQARAIAYGIEYFRSLRPHCMGTILWQLNDCWPVTSWAAIDGDGRLKPLWYELRRVYADRLVTIQKRGQDAVEVVLVNDGGEPWEGELVVERLDLHGHSVARASSLVSVQAGDSALQPVAAGVAGSDAPERELLVARMGAERSVMFFGEDRDMKFEPAEFTATTSPRAGGLDLTIVAKTLLRDVVIQADRIDPEALVGDSVFTLLPGESRTIGIDTSADPAGPRWSSTEVIRCVNGLSAFSAVVRR